MYFQAPISHEARVTLWALIPFLIYVGSSVTFTKQVPAGIPYNNRGVIGSENKHLVWLRQCY